MSAEDQDDYDELYIDPFDYINAKIISRGSVTTNGIRMDCTVYELNGDLKCVVDSDIILKPLPNDLFP